MADDADPSRPPPRDPATGKRAARRARSAAALRENLRRRKKPGANTDAASRQKTANDAPTGG